MNEFTLGGEFPAADEAHWMNLVEKVLAGRDFERTLVTKTQDGLSVDPLYSQQDSGRVITGTSAREPGGWSVFQRVDHPDVDEANRFALADLDGGVDGLEIVFPGAPVANGYGVDINSLDDLVRLFDGIDLSKVKIRVDGGYEIPPALAFFAALVMRLDIDPSAVDIVGQSDPANGLLVDGRLIASLDHISELSVDMARAVIESGLNLLPLVADARAVHAVGGSEVQELAYAIGAGVQHMRVLEHGGVKLEDARQRVTFAFAADTDQFATIAKLRAFRLLWARAQEACGMVPVPAHVHVETAWRMMTRRDPWVNLLRTTVATTAAGLGGADSVTVLPFTAALGLPDGFARRTARNIQLVLKEEAGLDRVADPTAGSGYVESLTTDMAEAAWYRFRQLEADGGIWQSLVDGRFQADIVEVRDRRATDIARRLEPITGVSEYPFLAELPVAALQTAVDTIEPSGTVLDIPKADHGAQFEAFVSAVDSGATMIDMVATISKDWVRAEKLPRIRLAEPFERLRDASDEALDSAGQRPNIFLATLGSMADFTTRASWARGAFEAGGIEAVGTAVYSDIDALVDAFTESSARLACLCATDAAYAEQGASVAEALKSAGAEYIYLAGRPRDNETVLRSAGIDTFLFAGCDILGALETAHRRLGLDGAQ